MMDIVAMACVQAAAAAMEEAKYVQTLSAADQIAYWQRKEDLAEISRRERAVRALEELAEQGRHPQSGFLWGLVLGSALS